jgi:hypothetical protein
LRGGLRAKKTVKNQGSGGKKIKKKVLETGGRNNSMANIKKLNLLRKSNEKVVPGF